MKFIIVAVVCLAAVVIVKAAFCDTASERLEAQGANFSWPEARSKSLKILVEYQDKDGEWRRASIGSGFLISSDGLFVSAYHVMKYCLQGQRGVTGFSVDRDCSPDHSRVRYRAQNNGREFGVKIVSHLTEMDSTSSKQFYSPDETIKQRDFIIGKLKAAPETHFLHWSLRDFAAGRIDVKNPRADFELKPLLPPKWVFVAGYPEDRDFEISAGFLNLTDENNRGYFAADYKL